MGVPRKIWRLTIYRGELTGMAKRQVYSLIFSEFRKVLERNCFDAKLIFGFG